MRNHTLPNVPLYYSITEMYAEWECALELTQYRRDVMKPALSKALRNFREENYEFARSRRKKFLLDMKKTLSAKIQAYAHKVDLMDISAWEKKWLMEKVAKWNQIMKKINGELAYVYGATTSSITDEDIARARLVDIVSLDLIDISSTNFTKCLWHEEKTASLKVYPAGRGFNCFGCGHSGSTIDIVMKVLNLKFVDAVKYLRGK